MLDNIPAVVPPTVAAAEAAAPAPEMPPPGESSLPAPTVEQAQTADHVFVAPTQPHAAATLLGVLTSAVLLRDLAVEHFDTSGEEDEEKEDKDEDSVD
ncbi:MAG TPA: hypothetical protein VH643_01795 [Gemmataceae bacterium]|jgi:hypothetical protein